MQVQPNQATATITAFPQKLRITINDVERTARVRRDGIGSVQVRETGRVQWLHVIYYKSSASYVYRWGRVSLTREGADLLLDEMSSENA